jgi:hexosaminidase
MTKTTLATRIVPCNRVALVFAFGLLIASASLAAQQVPPLMPMPEHVSWQPGHVPLPHRLRFDWRGYQDPLLDRAADRFVHRLTLRTGIDFVRDQSIDEPPLTIAIACSAVDPGFLTTKEDDRYRLVVSRSGASIQARGPAGVLRAFATLLQLVDAGADGYSLRQATIDDQPRFAWRGLQIDVSRHFMPVALVEHQVDAMELVKLNVLHLHLSDSESFSVESKAYPLLQRKGALDGRYYTQQQIRELIAYARDRGVRVVPEFEMPGHLKSWLVGYPYLASGPGPFHLGSDYAGGDAALNPSDERVYQFLNRLIGDMAALFPDQYFHIGGDEVLGHQWAANPALQQFMKAHSLQYKGQLQAYFTRRVNDIVRAHGKIMIGWDEVLDGNAPASVTIETWRSSRMTAVSVKAGHATIVATPYYLDLLAPAGKHYVNDPLDTNAWGIPEKDYQVADKEGGLLGSGFVLHGEIPLTAQEESLILGGEAQMWSETITPEMLDAGLWPRSAAIAERFWSPRGVKDVDDMYRRLYSMDRLLAALGTNQYANQQRMLFRIAPQDPGPLETLAAVVEPIKYLSHWHNMRGGLQPDQNTLADAALPESLQARQFCDRVHNLLSSHSDQELARRIQSQLQQWQDNDGPLVRSIGDIPDLQPVKEVSADLRTLSTIGLDAMGFISRRQAPAKDWIEAAHTAIARQQTFVASSSGYHNSAVKPPQPAAEVLIAVLPGIVELADAAEKIGH